MFVVSIPCAPPKACRSVRRSGAQAHRQLHSQCRGGGLRLKTVLTDGTTSSPVHQPFLLDTCRSP